jgi:hypothetical protein
MHMSKKAYFISAGCFILGLALGIGGTMAYLGKVAAEGIFLTKTGELAEVGQQAEDAYLHDSEPVAMYALSQYLAKLKDDEQLGLPPFMDRQDILFGMVMTHARLAHLYQMSGQTNLSAQETAEALRCAKMSGKFLWVTNEAALAKFVARGGARTVKP